VQDVLSDAGSTSDKDELALFVLAHAPYLSAQ